MRPDYCRDRKRCKNLRANASSDFAQKASFFEQCRTKFGQLYPDVGSLQYNSTKCRREIENSLSQSSCAPRKGCALKPFTLVPMFGIFERNLAWTFEHWQLLSICLQHDFTQAHPKRTVVFVFTRHRVPNLRSTSDNSSVYVGSIHMNFTQGSEFSGQRPITHCERRYLKTIGMFKS